MYNEPPKGIERWRLKGTLITKSPLHVGDGERRSILQDRPIPAHMKKKLEKANPEYATVFTGHTHTPIIPATSLKGALRAWAEAHGVSTGIVSGIFGDKDRTGRMIFSDAGLTRAVSSNDATARFWCPARKTALTPQVAIDPATRSAAAGLLYYLEYVPAGSEFELLISGQNTSDEELGAILHILENAFSSPDRPARLGSNGANDWGRVECTMSLIESIDIKAWLAGTVKPWHEALAVAPPIQQERWQAAAAGILSKRTAAASVRIDLTLRFQGSMLVNDPTRCKEADADGKDAIGHAAVRREDGKVYLPAQSVRGAFRSQARRIWQTLAWDREQNLDCLYSNQEIVARPGSQKDLAGFHQLFGATGWRSPIEIADFELLGDEAKHPQEFVAIDRFTGGACKAKKFNAHGLWKPAFRGALTIRTDRWESPGIGNWGWLLLAFVLRDWKEGDVAVGFGAAKGYGAFEADVAVTGTGKQLDILRALLAHRATEFAVDLRDWEESLAQTLARKGVA